MEPSQQQKPEEIDLLYFLSPIGGFFKKILEQIGHLVTKWTKNWLGILLVFIFITAIGFASRFILTEQYQTNAILLTHEIPADLCIIELQNLNQTIQTEDDFTLLAKQLQISKVYAEAITFIKAEKIEDIQFDRGEDTASQLFSVTLKLTNPELIDSIQHGIIQFLENNEYSIKRKEIKRISLNELKLNLQKKVESLDSLKAVVNSSLIPRGQGQGIILGEPVNPVSIYQAEIAYFKEQLKVNEELATLDNVEVIQPFIKIKKSNSPNFNLILLYSMAAGLLAGLFCFSFFGKK